MTKLLLSGEGKTDYGIRGSDGKWIDGPVQHLMKRVGTERQLAIDAFDRKADKRGRKGGFQNRQHLDGHAFEARVLAAEAAERGYDIAAFYVDADRAGKTEKDCSRAYHDLKDEILTGIQTVPGMKGIAVVPLKMIESWLMADPSSFNRLFGKADGVPDFPQKPELDWGDKRQPDSNFPQNRLARILRCYHEKPELNVYCRIADEEDLDKLRKNCPISFEDFYQQLIGIIGK